MANVYYLNQQPHPLWNILTDFGEHGLHMFSQQTPHAHAEHVNRHPHHRQRAQNTSQPTTQDSNNRPLPRPRGLDENTPRESEQENTRDIPFRGRGCRRGRGGPWGHPAQDAWGPHRRQRHCRPGAGYQSTGAPHELLQQFINNFSNQFGVDVGEVFNIINGTDPRSGDKEVDFVPRADVFDAETRYIIHVSLPGAQKKDISVDYDAETSTLRLAGVVYRPELDEELSNALIVDGRSREVGVFEREISLGSRDKPARVDADNISAKLVDGVLVLTLPKVVADKDAFRRRISVDQIRNENGREPEGEEAGSADPNNEKEEVAAESQAMQIDSETEASEQESERSGRRTPPSPSVRSEEEEERDYVAVDVD
ncbi:uncharacterized protein BDCG_04854 [Blastomyces dermatitidis ER-3]|uniref:SHSP domain-containing protein n=1 Tax=Ajellomyces dermatitidis (strain ER-3 / ATCC MYA-2586) TaxID=559297 RepID=A0ABP2EZI8_AJEDR|nr:uncharacterized protein BDCG_04854 [Blastomyces dermatitidis ER-3]EEQ89734.1 hypothetical protein BDCG_04854 [Blastomyces dermatitidis ER-3]